MSEEETNVDEEAAAETSATEAAAEQDVQVEVITPIIVDLGKVKAKQIKRLKKGQGELMDEVVDVLDEVVEVLGEELEGKSLVPVVLLYESKKKQKGNRIYLPFFE